MMVTVEGGWGALPKKAGDGQQALSSTETRRRGADQAGGGVGAVSSKGLSS